MNDSKSRGDINADLLIPHTQADMPAEGGSVFHRGMLLVEKGEDTFLWWVCLHRHKDTAGAHTCAVAAQEQTREGILTHQLTGADDE